VALCAKKKPIEDLEGSNESNEKTKVQE
jgi:hypothetical protein